MSKEIEITITLKVGTIKELPMALRQTLVSGEHGTRKYDLSTGGGLANDLVQASVRDGDRSMHAWVHAFDFAPGIFKLLDEALDADQPEVKP